MSFPMQSRGGQCCWRASADTAAKAIYALSLLLTPNLGVCLQDGSTKMSQVAKVSNVSQLLGNAPGDSNWRLGEGWRGALRGGHKWLQS